VQSTPGVGPRPQLAGDEPTETPSAGREAAGRPPLPAPAGATDGRPPGPHLNASRRGLAAAAHCAKSIRGSCNPLPVPKIKINQTKFALWAVCVSRAGYLDGGRLVELVDDWRDCVTAKGEPVGFEEYAQWTRRMSYRTAYNRLRLFRKTFPQLGPAGTPEGLLGPLLQRLAAEVEQEP
jgi:hypothetical protein